ncbi:MAG: hypothetical protein KVP17_004647 [Porospora cf. gigantea B]|uniref:uncharacterized protein n=1 Tax=Porospora cf. gigantea B TaxID=2853592 RepID=UPI003571E524|nr:MAG: hypothetical protein KVP17_004647 [Porospora cf. gigantea B]
MWVPTQSLLQQITPGNVIDDSGPGCYVLAGATVLAAYFGVRMASQLDQRIRLEAILGADSAHVNSRFCDMHEEMYTVMVSGIDHSSDQRTFETSVYEASRRTGAEVLWVHLVLNYAHVAAARRKLQSTYTKMLQKQHGVLAMKLNPRLTMVSLAPADQVAILQQTKALDQAYSKKVCEGTGVGFVCFSSPEAQMLALADPGWLKQGWRQEEAPAPRDIIWANLYVSLSFVFGIHAASSVFLTDYLLPVAVHLQHAARPVFSALKLSAVGFAPPAALLFVNAVVLPNLISWAATHSHYWQQSHYNIHVLHANAVFQTMNTLVLPITGGLSLGSLGFLVYSTDPRNWGPSIVGAVASNSGSFAIRYLLNVLFISNVSQLVQLPQLVVKACCGLLNIPVPKDRFEFGFWFAFDLVLTFVGFFFAISAPLVPLFVSATLACRFFIQKYNFAVGTWQISTDSKGALPR